MRSTLFSFNRLFVTSLLVVGLFLGLTPQVKAGPCDAPMDNDCPSVATCNITSGRNKIGVTTASRATINYTRKDFTFYYYKITACNLDPIIKSCGSTQTVNVAYKPTLAVMWKFADMTKNSSGCYEGEINMLTGLSRELVDFDYVLDVEINNTSGDCPKAQPVCRRAYVELSADQELNPVCYSAVNSVKTCSALNFKTTQLFKNNEITFNVTIPSELKKAECGVPITRAEVKIYDPDNKEVFSKPIMPAEFGKTISISYKPTMVTPECSSGYKVQLLNQISGNRSYTSIYTCSIPFGVGADEANACDAPVIDQNSLFLEKFKLCEQIPKTNSDGFPNKRFLRCQNCLAGVSDLDSIGPILVPDTPLGIWTAVGCIKTDPQNIIITVIRLGLGVAGGGALLMILSASFIISVSAGDAKKFTEAKEMISNAVIGLVFIIMSITILQFIGVSLFHIPGFGN